MHRRIYICSAILLISLSLIVAPALGISTTTTSGTNAGKATSTTTKCGLDNSAHFNENTVGSCGAIYQNSEISGTGENSLKKTASGDGNYVMSAFKASGSVNSKTSTAASGDGAVMSSDTSISGRSGYISSGSSTGTNQMGVIGGFTGEGGDIISDITSAALNGKKAYTGGSASMLGVECLNDEMSYGLAAKSDLGMTVNGIYAISDGNVGDFGLVATNEAQERGRAEETDTWYGDLGWSDAYVLAGWKWDSEDDIGIYVKDDKNVWRDESLKGKDVLKSVRSATNTWDEQTSEALFSSVQLDSKKRVDKHDGFNVVGWKRLPSQALAWSRTYYSTAEADKVDGYYKALESDICYNTANKWTTDEGNGDLYYYDPGEGPDDDSADGDTFDVETIALHELGHTLGLGDTYLDSDLKYDLSQIMSFYDDTQRELGVGDITGIQKLYGGTT